MTAAAAQPPAAEPPLRSGGPAAALVERVVAPLAMSCFVGAIALSGLLQALAAALIVAAPTSPWGWTLLVLMVALAVSPLRAPPAWAAAAISAACRMAVGYFPTVLVVEDAAALSGDKPYVIALEPHSALPTAIPAAFGERSVLLPPALRGRTHGLVSSVCFRFPLVRQLYYWWGFRPITKGTIRRLLAARRAVVLVPGGVQECLYMEPSGSEVAFVRSRKGFIRMAMQCGADVVPVFAFGQSQTYKWLRPGPPLVPAAAVAALSRKIGMVPLALLGRWGSPVPHRSRMTVVLGAPLRLPRHESPPDDLVQAHLDEYIAALEGIFERHRAAAGHGSTRLRVM
ncbi:diacylglycerol acyltransferase type 2 [Raphidocelis subcapitata]|uniref:Acyltransferase n=1 Tax=Raphidocelis subcapitata TaxID=307507 RepID=A0A2V0PA32_9CHLO|nr:diacylglycerol acyltransferase type 2 [Raphidocelis subcapitata]|eukprot:GBF96718.1 diacylglycerol acyltransferase type 2 [Raphidocelis subcapitata]